MPTRPRRLVAQRGFCITCMIIAVIIIVAVAIVAVIIYVIHHMKDLGPSP